MQKSRHARELKIVYVSKTHVPLARECPITSAPNVHFTTLSKSRYCCTMICGHAAVAGGSKSAFSMLRKDTVGENSALFDEYSATRTHIWARRRSLQP